MDTNKRIARWMWLVTLMSMALIEAALNVVILAFHPRHIVVGDLVVFGLAILALVLLRKLPKL